MQDTAQGSMLGLGSWSLVPPGSPDFNVGHADAVNRVREWAFANRYLLYAGPADRCVHGLYRMDSCTFSVCGSVGLDHPQIWVHHNGRGAFLLTHPYTSDIPESLRTYAQMHGLRVDSYESDRWYHDSALPIRLTVPANWPLWPIERDAIVVLHTQPITWPDED